MWDKPAAAGKTSPTAECIGRLNIIVVSPSASPRAARPSMSMVQLALRRPYTFIVMAMLIVLATPFALLQHGDRHLPGNQHSGDQHHLELRRPAGAGDGPAHRRPERARPDHHGQRHRAHRVASLAGITVIKVFFQPTANIQTAIAQVVASMQTQVRQLPPGITPPLVIKYSASSIPVIQLGAVEPDAARADRVRRRDQPCCARSSSRSPASPIPFPYGGKNRADLGRPRHRRRCRRAACRRPTWSTPSTLQNLILPSGTAKFGDTEYTVQHERLARRDRRPERPAGAHRGRRHHLPARRRLRARRLLAADQHRAPGRRARRAAVGAEERRRVDARHRRQPARACCRSARRRMPADIKVTPLFDQSVFVKAAVQGVVARGADRRRR